MSDSLLADLPNIRRAREYRLYGASGQRYIDFYQDGGHAILGHRPSRIILDMKNLLSRGQIAAYPSIYLKQAQKALRKLFPDAGDIRLYSSFGRALSAVCAQAGEMVDAEAIEDPAHGGECNGICAFWRPFIDAARIKAPMLLPILPLPIPPAPAVVVFKERPSKTVQPSDICSPMSLIAIKRGIFDLIRFMSETDRHLWTEFDVFTIWNRYGPYLRLNIDRKDFSPLFHELLEDGIVISPFFTKPSIVPAIFTPGELKHLNKYRRTGDTNGNR